MKLVKVCRNGTKIEITDESAMMVGGFDTKVTHKNNESTMHIATIKQIIELIQRFDYAPESWEDEFLPLGFEVVND